MAVTAVYASLAWGTPCMAYAQAASPRTATSPATPNEPLDFSQLNNRTYDYGDTVKAKTALQSEDDIARILKIAR